jgi:hypothetical protein
MIAHGLSNECVFGPALPLELRRESTSSAQEAQGEAEKGLLKHHRKRLSNPYRTHNAALVASAATRQSFSEFRCVLQQLNRVIAVKERGQQVTD